MSRKPSQTVLGTTHMVYQGMLQTKSKMEEKLWFRAPGCNACNLRPETRHIAALQKPIPIAIPILIPINLQPANM